MRCSGVLNPKSWLAFAKRETALTAALFAIALALLAFAGIADEMAEGDTRGFDEALLLAMRTADPADPIGPRWVEASVADISALGGRSVLTVLTVLAVGFLLVMRKYTDATVLLVAVIGAGVLSSLLKLGFARPRPDLVAHIVEVTSMSFPSGHAMSSAATYLTVGALVAHAQERRAVKTYVHAAAILLTLLIGVSRVYLGVHWPTDVLAGWCLGAAWAIACVTLAGWVTRGLRPIRGAPPSDYRLPD